MKRDFLFLSIVLAVISAIALGSTPPQGISICLSHAEVSAAANALNFSDETAEYIESGSEDNTITLKQIQDDVAAIHTMNNIVRTNLGLPTK